MISQGLKTEGRATGLVAVRVADVLTRNGEDDVTEARSVCEKKKLLGIGQYRPFRVFCIPTIALTNPLEKSGRGIGVKQSLCRHSQPCRLRVSGEQRQGCQCQRQGLLPIGDPEVC